MKYYTDGKSVYGYEKDQEPKKGLRQISEAEKDSMLSGLEKAEEAKLTASEKMKRELPSYNDFIEALIMEDTEALQLFRDKYKAIKAKYPGA